VREGGRVAYPNGIEPEPERRPKVKLASYDAEAGAREFSRLARAADDARLRVPIAATYPLGRADDAHRRLKKHVVGRIVLRP
jgi:NADPH:quinone reductase-like Zn-dependent oxidoreductase